MPILTANERIGTEIGGRYRLTRLLGEGAFGAVFEAEHTVTGRAVALKLLHGHLVQSQQIGQRFLLEAQAMAKIRHPGIVQVLDAGYEPDGTIFLALELLQGETLETTLARSGRMTRHEAIQIAIEVLDALAAAHALNIVHRDIKPGNIFLAREDHRSVRAKLLDFGIAHIQSREGNRLTSAGVILGTPEYMSPEQGRGAAVGPAADLWSIGIVLYEMLSGVVPWSSENPTAVLMAVANDPLPDIRKYVPDLPDTVVAILERALQKRPEDRFASATEMRDALRDALQRAEDDLRDQFTGARAGSREIAHTSAPALETVPPLRSVSGEQPALGTPRSRGNREFEFDLVSGTKISLDLDIGSMEVGSRPSRASVPPPPANPTLPEPPVASTTTANSGTASPTAPSVLSGNTTPASALHTTGKHPAMALAEPSPKLTGKHSEASSDWVRISGSHPAVKYPEASLHSASAPRVSTGTFKTPEISRPRTGLFIGLPLVLVAAGALGTIAFRVRNANVHSQQTDTHSNSTSNNNAEQESVSENTSTPLHHWELTERYAIALPFGTDSDGARMFGRHLTVGPASTTGSLRTIGTCIRDTVYLYSAGDGLPVISGTAPIACEHYDIALVPDVNGDGETDIAAITRGHDGVVILASRPTIRVLRTVMLPRAQGLVGTWTVHQQPTVAVYTEPNGPTGATEIVAVGIVSGQILWRARGRAPWLRLGHPEDVGLSVGPDANGDGIPDVAAGATVTATTPIEEMPARPRCVELLSGANGERIWHEPFCQGRGGSQSVSLGPDVNGDGRADVAVGTDVSRLADARVVLLSGADGRLLRRIAVPQGPAAAGFGWPVHLGPDVNGDNMPDLLVGSVGSTGTHVTVLSAHDGSLLASRQVRGAVGFPNLRMAISDGLIRGNMPAMIVSSPEDGLHVYVMGNTARHNENE